MDTNNPGGDIEAQYSGLRPADKLYEELLIGTNVSGTRHSRIMRANEEYTPKDDLDLLVEEIKRYAELLDRDRVRSLLAQVVSSYEPTKGIDDLISVMTRSLRESQNFVYLEKRSS